MEFKFGLNYLEFAIIGVFIVLYLLYLTRIAIISRKLNHSFTRVIYKLCLRTLIVLLLIVGLMGPYIKSKADSKDKALAVSKDIFIALDLSKSMDTPDIAPSRIERIKEELIRLTKPLTSDNIGIIIFSSRAYLHSPLTYDRKMTNQLLNICNTGLVTSKGTELYYPLKLALDQHMKNESTSADAKLILLVSDGEDFSDDTKSIANEIQKNDIKLFTLGVGTKKGDRIPTNGGFIKDQNGEHVISKLNAGPLKSLANITGGKYFELSDTRDEIDLLQKAIEDIKGVQTSVDDINKAEDFKFSYFLIIALILISIDVLIPLNLFKL